MPIQSKRQARWLAANRKDLFNKWKNKYPVKIKNLPEKVKSNKK